MEKKDKKLKVIDGNASTKIKNTLAAKKTISELFPSGEWTPVQVILQEIQANEEANVALGGKAVPLTKQLEKLKEEVSDRYSDNKELKKVLLDSIPNYDRVRAWVKTEGWREAVWNKIRGHEAFSNKNKLSLIMMLLNKGIEKQDVRAADLYFKLSGELLTQTKVEPKSKGQQDFDDLQKALHSKK